MIETAYSWLSNGEAGKNQENFYNFHKAKLFKKFLDVLSPKSTESSETDHDSIDDEQFVRFQFRRALWNVTNFLESLVTDS